MFSNVGGELKNWARFFFVIIMIPVCLSALAVLISLSAFGGAGFMGGLIVAAIIVILGYAGARLSCIMLYAFGDLVESNAEIEKKVSIIQAQMAAGDKKPTE